MKYLAVGDVHGRFDLLEMILDIWKKEHSEYRLVFLGDMIDRGPDSFKVVDTIKTLTEQGHIALLGNHEGMMLEYNRNKIVDRNDIWLYNGGNKTVDSYGKETGLYGNAKFFDAFEKSGHDRWMRNLPLFYEDKEVIFTHAPIPKEKYMYSRFRRKVDPKKDFRTDEWFCTWSFHGETLAHNEEEFVRDHGKLAVCGHVHALRENILTPRFYKDCLSYDKIVYADTGCGCWIYAPLSGILVEDGKAKGYIQVP